jgi:Kef-type K+ transport system membrane component KefB
LLETHLPTLSEEQVLLALLALATILCAARAAGEIARRVGQPEVLGELLAGFVLGPSVFGVLLPGVRGQLFLHPPVALVLSGLSWIGAILLLLMAGMEVDLAILRRELKPGVLAAALCIVPSLIAGSLFSWLVIGRTPPNGVFLGIVLSVTAVSVAARILLERGATRRRYAQVILAAGVASEVVVWLFVSVVSSIHSASPVLAGVRSLAFALIFFAVMMTGGRRFVFWAMRRVSDATWITKGQLSLVLVLTFVAAAVTQALGLHALLGAFVVGVLLGMSPRSNEDLANGLRSLTVGLLAPIFFVLAGMKVNVLQLGTAPAVETVVGLFVVATVVKVGLGTVGARLGGQGFWEAALVGVGLNLKGGTDVVVAVIGTELGLLSARTYSMYAVVAIVTVLVTPPAITWLESKAPPTDEENERLDREEGARRAYVPRVERVLVPVEPRLLPVLAASVVGRLAQSKQDQAQLFDITQFDVRTPARAEPAEVVAEAQGHLEEAGALGRVEVTQRRVSVDDELQTILDEASNYDLIAIGASAPDPDRSTSLGQLQDAIIHRAPCDVLIVVDTRAHTFDCAEVRRILVPANGLEYSMAAGDIAAALAQSCGAALVLFAVVQSHIEDEVNRRRDHRRLEKTATGFLDELAFRVRRLGVEAEKKVVARDDASAAVLDELGTGAYDLVVMGGVDRGASGHPYAGKVIRTVLTKGGVPGVVLISRERGAVQTGG